MPSSAVVGVEHRHAVQLQRAGQGEDVADVVVDDQHRGPATGPAAGCDRRPRRGPQDRARPARRLRRRLGRAPAPGHRTAADGDRGGSSSGRSRVNTDPAPGSDDTAIVPPSSRGQLRLIDRPRPVPPYLRLVVPSACWNASKIIASLSPGMPMPVSRTANATTERALSSAGTPWSVPGGARPICSVTLPASVNLTALDSRLRRICCSRWASVVISRGQLRRRPRRAAPGPSPRPAAPNACSTYGAHLGELDRRRARRPSGRPRSWTGRGCRRSGAAGPSRRCGWCWRTRSASAVRFGSGLSASSRDSSSSELSGVRSSWLMLARNSDLYWRPARAAAPSPPGRAGPARSPGS